MPRTLKPAERVHQMNMRVPYDLYAQVWDKAQAEGVDVKDVVIRALKREVAQESKGE